MKLFELYADLSLDASGFDNGVKKATKMGSNLAGTLKGSIGGAAQFVGKQVSATTVMLGNLMTDMARKGAEVGKQVFTTGIDYNRQMETYVTNFTTMLDGSSAAAEKLTADLEDMAASTPFAMADLADATQVLMQFGQDSETVMGTLESLGDIAMGDKNKLQSLTLAFAQASSSGKLMGQDLMQMINAGFNPLQTIVDKTGASMADLKEFMSNGKASAVLKKQMQEAQKEVARMGDQASVGAKMLVKMAEDGAISAELLGQIFDIETSPGGKFYKAMENASKTFNGMVSTLEDDTAALMGKVMEPAFDFMTDTLLPKAIAVVGELDEAYDLGGLTGMANKATEILGETLGTWGTVAFDAGSGMLAEVLSGLTGDTVNKEEIKDFFTGVASDGSAALNAIVTTGSGLLAGIWEGLSGDTENETNIVQKISGLWTDGTTSLNNFKSSAGNLLKTIYTKISGQEATANNIGKTIGGVFNAGTEAVLELLGVGSEFMRDLDYALKSDPQSEGQISAFLGALFDAAGTGMDGVITTSGNFLSNLYKSITNDTEGAEKIKQLFSDIGDATEETVENVGDVASKTTNAYEQMYRDWAKEWRETKSGAPTLFGFTKKTVEEGLVPTPEEQKSQLASAHEETSLLAQLFASAPLIIAQAGKDLLDNLFSREKAEIDLSENNYQTGLSQEAVDLFYDTQRYQLGYTEEDIQNALDRIRNAEPTEIPVTVVGPDGEEILPLSLGNLEMGFGMEATAAEEFGYFDNLNESVNEMNATSSDLSGVVEMLQAAVSEMQTAISGMQSAAIALANRKLEVFVDGRSMAGSLAPYSDEILAVPFAP